MHFESRTWPATRRATVKRSRNAHGEPPAADAARSAIIRDAAAPDLVDRELLGLGELDAGR